MNNSLANALSACAIILTLAATGCTTHHVYVEDRQGDTVTSSRVDEGTTGATRVVTPSTQARLNTVGFLEPNLNRRIAVESTGARRNPTNTLEVYASLRNRTDYTQNIQVRVQFFGPGRFPLEGPGPWQNVSIPQNGIQTYRVDSLGTDAESYYIEVQALR